MNSVQFIDPAVVLSEDYSLYIGSSDVVSAQVRTWNTSTIQPAVDELFGITDPKTFASFPPPPEPPTNQCFNYEVLGIDVNGAVEKIDNLELFAEQMFSLLYKLEHLNTLSREVAHRRDSILHG